MIAVGNPNSDVYLGNPIHNDPRAYWCADCWKWRYDCEHLVEPLVDAPTVILGNCLIQSVSYDRERLILELEMNTGERFQYFKVPRRIAIGLIQASSQAHTLDKYTVRIDGVDNDGGIFWDIQLKSRTTKCGSC
jgi:hypothetical protein